MDGKRRLIPKLVGFRLFMKRLNCNVNWLRVRLESREVCIACQEMFSLDSIKAECLILDQRSAQRTSELFAIEIRFCLFKKSICLQILLPIEEKAAAVQRVGS